MRRKIALLTVSLFALQSALQALTLAPGYGVSPRGRVVRTRSIGPAGRRKWVGPRGPGPVVVPGIGRRRWLEPGPALGPGGRPWGVSPRPGRIRRVPAPRRARRVAPWWRRWERTWWDAPGRRWSRSRPAWWGRWYNPWWNKVVFRDGIPYYISRGNLYPWYPFFGLGQGYASLVREHRWREIENRLIGRIEALEQEIRETGDAARLQELESKVAQLRDYIRQLPAYQEAHEASRHAQGWIEGKV